VIHGDLKGVRGYPGPHSAITLTPIQIKILVDNSGHACFADFEFATVAYDMLSTLTQGYSFRWAAPEILKEEVVCSMGGDIFSFAMVAIEVCYG